MPPAADATTAVAQAAPPESEPRTETEAPPVAPAAPSGPPAAMAPFGSLALLDAMGDVRPLDEIEAETIRFAIAHYRGQMSEVARRLRIGRSTLYRKLDSLGLDAGPPDHDSPAL
jgi:DNA-binding NtrC family response regulator